MNIQARWLVVAEGAPSPPFAPDVMCWPVDPANLLGACFVPLLTEPEQARQLAAAINARGFGSPDDNIRFEAVHVDSPADLSTLLNHLRRLARVEYVTVDLPEPGGDAIPADALVPIAAAVFALDLAQ